MQTLVNILFLSTFYVSFAVGLALIFGVMRTINYAHGELYMIGAYVLLITISLFAGRLPNFLILVIALVAAAALVGLFGALIQKTLIEPLRDKPFSIFMSTLGLSYILQVVVIKVAGPSGRVVRPLFPGVVRIGGAVVPIQRLAVLGATMALIAALWLLLLRTNIGRGIRAAAQNRTGAVLQGVNIKRAGLTTMVIGSALAATSGVLMGTVISINPFMGGEAIWFAFVVIIVGGIGNLAGAVLAALLFGVLNTLLTGNDYGEYVGMIDAAIMLAILSVMPNGLLGSRE
jgi:branched-subunit amino acid ABC-type transport system permease component